MQTMFRRITQAVGEDVFHEEVTKKYPMPLDDASVVAIAVPLGWKQEWLRSAHAKAKAKAASASSQNLAHMLSLAGPRPSEVSLPLQPPSVRSPGVAPVVAAQAPVAGSLPANGVSWTELSLLLI